MQAGFPAPFEVDRYLYANLPEQYSASAAPWFPAPREVDRYLYTDRMNLREIWLAFPAPREVRRFLYFSTPRY